MLLFKLERHDFFQVCWESHIGFIVAADSEAEAREVASSYERAYHRKEGDFDNMANDWVNDAEAKISLIGTAGGDVQSKGIVFKSFKYG